MAGASNKISYIVRLRQRLRRWRKKAAEAAARGLPSDVPSGHIAVSVGASCRRFVVPTAYLNHPLFQNLLLQAEEEYGFANSGPLAIPCGEEAFEEILQCLARTESCNNQLTRSMNLDEFQRVCHMDFRSNLDFLAERPLLNGLAGNSIW